MSPRNFGEFTMPNFRDTRTNGVRVSHNGRATEYCATLARMSRDCRIKMKISYIRGKVVRHSHKCRATVVRQSRDIFSKLDRNSRMCCINVYSMRLQRESCVYIVNLCREIVANCSLTCLQLSHSSEIGA